MLANSMRKVVAAASGRLGKRAFAGICALSGADALVLETRPPEPWAKCFPPPEQNFSIPKKTEQIESLGQRESENEMRHIYRRDGEFFDSRPCGFLRLCRTEGNRIRDFIKNKSLPWFIYLPSARKYCIINHGYRFCAAEVKTCRLERESIRRGKGRRN